MRKGSNSVAEGTQKEEAKDRVDDAFYEQANRRHEQKLIENEEAKRRTSVSGNENRVGEKGTVLGDATRLFASTLALFILDKVVSKEVAQAGIKFPGPLVVMFAVIIVLLALDAVAKNEEESLSNNVLSAFKPAMDWITSWLPVFYVPSLVTLPLVVSTMEV